MELDTYPLTRYNPEFGAVTVETLEDAQKTFQPEHNWFKTAEEADAHRTEAEAGRVLQHSRRMLIDQRGLDKTDRVMMSVQHEENTVKPMREMRDNPLPPNPPVPPGNYTAQEAMTEDGPVPVHVET